MMKRTLSILLALCLVFSMTALAAYEPTHGDEAMRLFELGLFNGTDAAAAEAGNPVFELEREATRAEALVMLIRMLGLEAEAKAFAGASPAKDMAGFEWADRYVAFAYDAGLTKGTGDGSTFSPGDKANANMYLTFLLRALGYDDGAGEFSYFTAYETAAEKGLCETGEYGADSKFYRDDCAYTSYNALSEPTVFGWLLIEELVVAGAVDSEAAIEQGLVDAGGFKLTYDYGMGYTSEFAYDASGMELSCHNYYLGQLQSYYLYTHDDADRLVKSASYKPDGTPADYIVFSYDGDSEHYSRAASYAADGTPLEYADHTYFANGNTATTTNYRSDGTLQAKYIFREDGTLLSATDYYESGDYCISEFDAEGEVVKRTSYNAAGAVEYYTTYEWVDAVEIQRTYLPNHVDGGFELHDYIHFGYDEYGNATVAIHYDANGVETQRDVYDIYEGIPLGMTVYYPDGTSEYVSFVGGA